MLTLELFLTLMIGVIIGATQERMMSIFSRLAAVEAALKALVISAAPATTGPSAEDFAALTARVTALEGNVGDPTDGEKTDVPGADTSTTATPTADAGPTPAASEPIDQGSSGATPPAS